MTKYQCSVVFTHVCTTKGVETCKFKHFSSRSHICIAGQKSLHAPLPWLPSLTHVLLMGDGLLLLTCPGGAASAKLVFVSCMLRSSSSSREEGRMVLWHMSCMQYVIYYDSGSQTSFHVFSVFGVLFVLGIHDGITAHPSICEMVGQA
jgi:hypothetical protein